MNIVLNAIEMQQADAKTIREFKVPSLVLMERAAVSVCDYIQANYPSVTRVGICCGTGNNGGDGLAIARILHTRGLSVMVYLAGDKERMSEDCRRQAESAESYRIHFAERLGELHTADIFVDALFGTGLSRPVEGEYAEAIQYINRFFTMPKIAVDIPSGIDATSGQILGCAVRCDVTVTFAFIKRGQLLYPGRYYAGRLSVAEIGISRHSLSEAVPPNVFALTKRDIPGLLPVRAADGNKGTFGKVLCICGSKNMVGAALLSAKAALKSGCGMVKVFTDESNRTILQTALPEALFAPYAGKANDADLKESMEWADVIVIGSGLSMSPIARQLFATVIKKATKPIVMDADALNILSEDTSVLKKPHTDIAITPHVAEMSRLGGVSVAYVKEHIVDIAQEFADEFAVHCVLKDAATVTAVPHGKTFINMTGGHALATAGSGDVLAGMIAGLCAQGLSLDAAAPLAVYLHGAAGDLAAEKLSAYSVTASDVIGALPSVLKGITA
ncbi:MAG: NAD(P)H-hydrate dehydratase [Lachnospiraceae bacterium]|nr:NAD(P)H-hydrate dehydratase [Lachnospiraceae bacterium]